MPETPAQGLRVVESGAAQRQPRRSRRRTHQPVLHLDSAELALLENVATRDCRAVDNEASWLLAAASRACARVSGAELVLFALAAGARPAGIEAALRRVGVHRTAVEARRRALLTSIKKLYVQGGRRRMPRQVDVGADLGDGTGRTGLSKELRRRAEHDERFLWEQLLVDAMAELREGDERPMLLT